MNDRFIPPSTIESSLKKNVDKQDEKLDEKVYETELMRETRDFMAQAKHMIEQGSESASCVFDAIEDTSREMDIAPMRILEMIGLTPAEELFPHAPQVQDLVYRSYPEEKGMLEKAQEDDRAFQAYKDYYIYKTPYHYDRDGILVKGELPSPLDILR